MHFIMNKGNSRENIKVGSSVGIVLKQDQRDGKITQGTVKKILTIKKLQDKPSIS